MRIGLSGGGATIDRMVEQARSAQAGGFSSLWYAGATAGDPLSVISVVGREVPGIELGTSVVQTYPVHPLFQAQRAASAAIAAGRGFTLGIGPSHQPVIEGTYGMSYEHPGRHTEEYLTILTAALRGEAVDFDGEDFKVRAPARPGPAAPVSVLVSALG
ncbi:MAG TPA: LLM class flavin-dependent oxidoreductase, partial [Acidimicrobiales bacterium]|nr:LLM class flavin-dependent oxidoreductase [Acidimicrobiales bacterium]